MRSLTTSCQGWSQRSGRTEGGGRCVCGEVLMEAVRPENCFAGGGMAWAPGEGGGGAFQKWASVPGPLFCVRTDVAAKGAGTQILARKIFFHEKMFPRMCVVKTISATWGSF